MKFDAFVGPSSTMRSVNADCERTINLFPEVIDGGGTGKSRAQLYGTPGVRPFLHAVDGVPANALSQAPVRGLFAQDGRAFAVAGGALYELFANHTATVRGTVAVDGRPACLCSNGVGGHQLFITSGGYGYIFDLVANTLTAITDDGFPYPALMNGFADGYFVVLQGGASAQFQLSALYDGLTWSGLDVAQVSVASDQVLAMVVDHREIWCFGSKTSGPWFNNGDASFPFAPVQGAFIEGGIIAPYSAVKIDNSVFWLDGDERGAGIVRRAHGYTPQRISHHALEDALTGVRLDDAIGWAYADGGHLFYMLYVPAHETTWCYDVATNLWHERALWDPDQYRWWPDIGRCHAFAFGQHLVGDRQSGCVYAMSRDFYDYELPA